MDPSRVKTARLKAEKKCIISDTKKVLKFSHQSLNSAMKSCQYLSFSQNQARQQFEIFHYYNSSVSITKKKKKNLL